MNPHGDFKIELIDNVVHVYPSGGFNEQGVELLNEEIVSIAPQDQPWAVLEHPKNSAGLTPEALSKIAGFYQKIGELNCVALGFEISSTWKGVLEKAFIDKVDIPICMSNDLEKVELFIHEKLICA